LTEKNFENYQISRLDNGIRVISEKIPGFKSISLGIWVLSGTRNESKEFNGITHLIEHLVFKGTKNRSNRDIAIEFDSIGADFNAFTDKENSCFYCDFIDIYLDKCCELLFDIVLNPLFLPESLETEKNIILEEIKMIEDSPSDEIFNYFYEIILKQHPLSFPILGTKKSLLSIKIDDVWNYFKKTFVFENMVVSAAGNVSHSELVKTIENKIKNFDYHAFNEEKSIYFSPEASRDFKIIRKKIKAANLCLGSVGCDRRNKNKYPLTVLMNLLGGSVSSRFFQKIREDMGLAYSIAAGNTQYTDTGIIDIYAASDPKNTGKIIKIIYDEINDIRKTGLKEIELQRAKENIKGGIVLNMEVISSRMFRFGKSLLMDNDVLPIENILSKIDLVSIDDVHAAANKFLDTEKMGTVIMGEVSKRGLI